MSEHRVEEALLVALGALERGATPENAGGSGLWPLSLEDDIGAPDREDGARAAFANARLSGRGTVLTALVAFLVGVGATAVFVVTRPPPRVRVVGSGTVAAAAGTSAATAPSAEVDDAAATAEAEPSEPDPQTADGETAPEAADAGGEDQPGSEADPDRWPDLPDDPALAAVVLTHTGDTARQAEEWANARAAYEEALRRDENVVSARAGLAEVLVRLDEGRAAVRHARLAYEAEMGNAGYLALLGYARLAAGQRRSGNRLMRRARRMSRRSPEVRRFVRAAREL